MPARCAPTDRAGVAAFDFDGTLTRGRTIFHFARHLAGGPGLAWAGVLGIRHAGFPPSRTAYKQAMLASVLAGRDLANVRDCGRRFADHIVAHRLDGEMLDNVHRHRAAGDQLVIVTAALDVYVEPVADQLGFDGVIATRVHAEDGACTGRLVDADLHDERKVDLLQAWLGGREPTTVVTAYGNSGDDDELLDYAASTQHRNRSDHE